MQKAQSDTPAQFLYHLKTERNDFVDASEYQVLDNLYNDKGIPAELLNVLTYACLKVVLISLFAWQIKYFMIGCNTG
ncbi:hypothetical protein SDC49_24450 [Lactobacillus sp. R2/2]|nr:hypothetical protein [Lactobacillus sp. R2/2]